MKRLALIGLFLFIPTLASADAIPEGKRLYLFNQSGRWMSGKVRFAGPDSLVLLKDRDRRESLARADIARAWIKRRDLGRHALASGITGAIGGAFIELTLGDVDAGDVARSTGIGAGFGVAGGALSSLLFGDDAWSQVIPAPAIGFGEAPFPPWAATVRGGIVRSTASESGTDPHFGLTLWAFDSPNVTVGAECGALPRSESTVRAIVPSGPSLATVEVRTRDRLAFATTQLRWRFLHTGLRPQATLGVGEYISRRVVDEALQDSTGAFQPVWTSRRTDSSVGANLGVGLGGQAGDLRPGVEVRAHWVSGSKGLLYSLAAFLDFR